MVEQDVWKSSPALPGESGQPRGTGGQRLFLSAPLQEYPLAALAGTACHCGFPTTRFPLHEREDEQLCAQKCSAEEFESCGTPRYFIVYQTQVQGRPGLPQQTPGGFPPRGAPGQLLPYCTRDTRAGLGNLARLGDPKGPQSQGHQARGVGLWRPSSLFLLGGPTLVVVLL